MQAVQIRIGWPIIPAFGDAQCPTSSARRTSGTRRPCFEAVRQFAAFGADNAPYGEHAFGVLGQKVDRKIDTYDRELCYSSEDSTDPELTTRVLTLLLPGEY